MIMYVHTLLDGQSKFFIFGSILYLSHAQLYNFENTQKWR